MSGTTIIAQNFTSLKWPLQISLLEFLPKALRLDFLHFWNFFQKHEDLIFFTSGISSKSTKT